MTAHDKEKVKLMCCTDGCGKPAEWVIQPDNDQSGQTHACSDHAGHMLGWLPDTDEPETWVVWHVSRES